MSLLNPNCQNLIISYLTPLPKLPFLEELIHDMYWIELDLRGCIYYQSRYLVVDKGICLYLPCRIIREIRKNPRWRVGHGIYDELVSVSTIKISPTRSLYMIY